MTPRIVYIDASEAMTALLPELDPGGRIEIHTTDPDPGEVAGRCAPADIVLNGHTTMTAADIRAAPRLKSIVFLGTGASSFIDVEAAAAQGVRIRTVRGYGDRTIAEHAFALLLAASRNVAAMDRDIRAGRWATRGGLELAGRTLGIIGTGGVGREMARMATGFGMRVLGWNRSGVPAGYGIAETDMETLLATADAISVHLALVPETRGLFDAARIARMKPGVVVVNTARGAIFEEAALLAALTSGHIGHAALDVFETEPLPKDHPLTRLPNVTLTAHAAWNSEAARLRLITRTLELAFADAAVLERGGVLAD